MEDRTRARAIVSRRRPKTVRWAGLAILGAATVASLAFGPAAAGAGETPVVSSAATAFQLSVPNLTLTSGYSSSEAYEGGLLGAEGAGVLAPAPSGEATATARPGESEHPRESCGGQLPAFPSPLTGLVSGSLACGAASARSASGESGASQSGASSARLSISLSPVLSQLPVTPASPLAAGLQGLLGKLPQIPAAGEPVSSVLSSLPNASKSQQTITIAVGPAGSASRLDNGRYTTTALAKGSIITIMPGAGPGGAALARIVVGGASATASIEGGKPAASDVPALVSVEVDTAATGPKSYSVVPGQSLTILAGTPLQSTIEVGSGSVSTAPSGAETARASAVTIRLAEGLGASPATAYNGGLSLALASAQATSAAPRPVLISRKTTKKKAAPPATPPAAAPPVVPNATTPHTGLPWAGGAPLMAGGALAGGSLLSWPWLKRRLWRR